MALANTAALQAAGIGAARPLTSPAATIVRDAPASRPACSKTTPWRLVERHVPAPSPAAMRSRPGRGDAVTWPSAASPPCITWARGTISRSFDARPARAARLHNAHLCRGAARRPGSGSARRVQTRRYGGTMVAATTGCASAGSRGSSMARSARTRRRSSSRSPTRRRIAGCFVNTAEDLERWTAGADAAGLQVAVHAIGDRAIRLQLDIFERVRRDNGPRDRRFRIEHAQHLAPGTSRASRSSASSPACSRITRSTTAAGRRG